MGKMLNINEVAERTLVAVSTLRKYTMLNRIPYKKFGSKVVFDSEEIELWIKANSFGLESITQSGASGTVTAASSAPAPGELFPVAGKRGK
ncbi:transcriptional regulator, AlpA family [Treponema primitia ZAS-2]|uniref:Transcriptional regulator, AlpA family n=1 Tax=Treponema primitia (strain ATCC BAA-887 / DSM 12427 / ZAS-2) TaxID=545694 RepID=F5YJQ2_TREPZ|nr:helix-turn-helix domain-containing protein [Treponema primitia]AEF86537.1 transcriptional regulator, AlpA family [Treponema primitia ZAS-2]